VFDLPQLYTKPSAVDLLDALELLCVELPSWDEESENPPGKKSQRPRVRSEGVTQYLTSIISSPLAWIRDESEQERVWERASLRLSERSGRTAMVAMTRTFRIQPLNHEIPQQNLDMIIHEPTLTADNLGWKTWASAFVLARRIFYWHFQKSESPFTLSSGPILELGAGTGLVGFAASAILGREVLLTDLPNIVPNLQRNSGLNKDLIESRGGEATVAVLDWTDPTKVFDYHEGRVPVQKSVDLFDTIVATDSVYSTEHGMLLANTVTAWLSRKPEARVVVELPMRVAYQKEITNFRDCFERVGLKVVDEGKDVGRDDWGDDFEVEEVRCWWSVWTWA
ncbi:hypothetical protein P152DRAFT_394280, partial [Eremomyces bilateralis CBS 781.70]